MRFKIKVSYTNRPSEWWLQPRAGTTTNEADAFIYTKGEIVRLAQTLHVDFRRFPWSSTWLTLKLVP